MGTIWCVGLIGLIDVANETLHGLVTSSWPLGIELCSLAIQPYWPHHVAKHNPGINMEDEAPFNLANMAVIPRNDHTGAARTQTLSLPGGHNGRTLVLSWLMDAS